VLASIQFRVNTLKTEPNALQSRQFGSVVCDDAAL
jgi:hypothetical protein